MRIIFQFYERNKYRSVEFLNIRLKKYLCDEI